MYVTAKVTRNERKIRLFLFFFFYQVRVSELSFGSAHCEAGTQDALFRLQVIDRTVFCPFNSIFCRANVL